MKLNTGKCELVVQNPPPPNPFAKQTGTDPNIAVTFYFADGTKLMKSTSVKYLGQFITDTADVDSTVSDVKRKIGATYQSLRPIFTNRNLSRKWKMLIYFAVIVSQVQYALGTMRLSPAHIRSISSLYHAHLRTIVNTLQPFAAL
jgi:hypothetical protein